MHEWNCSVAHTVSVVLHHTVNLFFYSAVSFAAFVHLCSNKPLPPSPIRLHPPSAECINTCRHAEIYRHTISDYCWEAKRVTHTHTHILTIEVLETLCTSTWYVRSYLPPLPLPHIHTHILMHIYTLLCEANNVRQALLSCDRAWNIETTEQYEPSLTSTILIQFIL